MNFDPVEVSFKWILVLGRVIGVIPFTIKVTKPKLELHFRWGSFSACHSLILAITMLFISIPNFSKSLENVGTRKNILQQLTAFDASGFQVTVVFVCAYFLKNAKRTISLLHHWTTVTSQLNFQTNDIQFPTFCFFISSIILAIGITENILRDFSMFETEAHLVENLSFLHKLYVLEAQAFSNFVPYHPITATFILYAMRVAAYSWNFGDIFLIVLCRALTFKFWQLNREIQDYLEGRKLEGMSIQKIATEKPSEIAEKSFQENETSIEIQQNSQDLDVKNFWKLTREKIIILIQLSHEVTAFVGPLVVACYGCNIVLIITRILHFLYGSTSSIPENSAYVYTSSFQFIMRVVLVTYYASQVYHSTEPIIRTIECLPDDSMSEKVARLERLLERHPVGVTIFGAIRITRKFFISIISFMFTTEIILLQAMSASSGNGN